MSIAERIIKKRNELGLSQTDLAKRAGLKPPAISQYESGTRSPSYEALIKLSNALNVTTDYLISGNEINIESIKDQSTKLILKIINTLSLEDKDKLLEYAIFLTHEDYNRSVPVLNEAVEYADYILKNIYTNLFPIDVYEIAKLLNIAIYKQEFVDEYEGLLIQGKEKIIILNSKNKDNNRSKFTTAMLIGHAIIPWHVKPQYKVRKSGTSTLCTEDVEEMESQNFAANLIMPNQALTKDFVKNDISIEDLKELAAKKYEVSLFALSNRLVKFAKDKYAVVQSENWNILKRFEGSRPTVEKINPNSKAATFFENPSSIEEIRKAKISAEYWFSNSKPGEFVYEESIYNPEWNKVLTLLRYIGTDDR